MHASRIPPRQSTPHPTAAGRLPRVLSEHEARLEIVGYSSRFPLPTSHVPIPTSHIPHPMSHIVSCQWFARPAVYGRKAESRVSQCALNSYCAPILVLLTRHLSSLGASTFSSPPHWWRCGYASHHLRRVPVPLNNASVLPILS